MSHVQHLKWHKEATTTTEVIIENDDDRNI